MTLTDGGRHVALQIVRKHRRAERFLVDILGMDWKDVHEEACRLEHAVSPEVATRMEAMLDHAATCPHGHPIPDTQGRTTESPVQKLSSLKRGQHAAAIARIEDEKRDLLEYLDARHVVLAARSSSSRSHHSREQYVVAEPVDAATNIATYCSSRLAPIWITRCHAKRAASSANGKVAASIASRWPAVR